MGINDNYKPSNLDWANEYLDNGGNFANIIGSDEVFVTTYGDTYAAKKITFGWYATRYSNNKLTYQPVELFKNGTVVMYERRSKLREVINNLKIRDFEGNTYEVIKSDVEKHRRDYPYCFYNIYLHLDELDKFFSTLDLFELASNQHVQCLKNKWVASEDDPDLPFGPVCLRLDGWRNIETQEILGKEEFLRFYNLNESLIDYIDDYCWLLRGDSKTIWP